MSEQYITGPSVKGGVQRLRKNWEATIDGPVTGLEGWLYSEGGTASVRTLYHEVGFVRKMVDLRAATVAGIPFEVTRSGKPVFTSDADEAIKGLEYLADLEDVLFRQSVSSMLTGASYERILSDGRQFNGFRYMYAETIKPKWDNSGELAYFERTVKGKREALELETVLYCWPFDPYVETGPVIAQAEAFRTNASVVNNLSKFADKYLERGVLKNSLISVPTGTAPEEKFRLKQIFDGLWSGVKGTGKSLVLESGAVEVTTIGDGLSDLGDMSLTQTEMKQIADAVGIPHSIALDDSANYATSLQSDLRFLESVAIPEARKFARAWNGQHLNKQGLHLRFTPNKMRAFQASRAQMAAAALPLVGRPIWTVEEARAFTGEDEIPSGELFIPAAKPAELPPKSLAPAVQKELTQWYKKASKNRGAEFWCEHIPADIAEVVQDRLRIGFPLPAAFEEPF